MSRVTLLHLSDIHIKGADTVGSAVIDAIVRTLRPHVRDVTQPVGIILSGDVAFSGSKEQYEVADYVLKQLIDEVKREGARTVFVMTAPGNHDCCYDKYDDTRGFIVNGINTNSIASEKSIDAVTSCQQNYFDFADGHQNDRTHRLWWKSRIDTGSAPVTILSLNTAWLSKLDEKEGGKFFPVEQLRKEMPFGEGINLAVMHHPPNWFTQQSYHDLRSFFRENCVVAVTGHEHRGLISSIETSNGQYIHIEADALIPETRDDPMGFGIVEIDVEARSVRHFQHTIGSAEVVEATYRIDENHSAIALSEKIRPQFQAVLDDVGGNFTKSDGSQVKIGDIYVYPELKIRYHSDTTLETLSSGYIVENINALPHSVVYGEETSGKTKLLHRIFSDLRDKDYFPVLIDCGNLNNAAVNALRRRVETAADAQYFCGKALLNEPKEKLVLLLDDLDATVSIPYLLKNLLGFADEHFGSVIVTADSGFNMASLVDHEVATRLQSFVAYDVKPFGYKLRYHLIRKWCIYNGETVQDQLDQKLHQIENVFNTVIGRNLVPSHPLYLLVLLQGMEAGNPTSLQNSGFAYYYQFLISKGLNDAHLKPGKHEEVMHYLSHLAWFFKCQDCKTISHAQFQAFNKSMGEKFFDVDLRERIELLQDAKLVSNTNDEYFFNYSYIYHFFLGKYLAKNLDDQEVEAKIDQMCMNLRDKESAHAILFLSHHPGGDKVIGKVSAVLKKCFENLKELSLEHDVKSINSLVDATAELVFEKRSVLENQVESRVAKDEGEHHEANQESRIENESTPFAVWAKEVYLLYRTSEILGQIIKNYYGVLERPFKQELIGQVFDAPMRLMRSLLNIMGDDPENLAKDIERNILKSNPNAPEAKLKELSRTLAFDALGMAAFSLIARPAFIISIEQLQSDIDTVAAHRNSINYKLNQAATWLCRPSLSRIEDLKKMAATLKASNPFAFTILQSLGAMHMHMFYMREPERQRLCAALSISFKESKKTDPVTNKQKALSNKAT